MEKIEIVKMALQQLINNIDAGNSRLSEDQCNEILDMVSKAAIAKNKYSVYQACKYLNISRATFDRYVKSGIIPEGRKEQGFKELFYLKEDLDNAKNKINNK